MSAECLLQLHSYYQAHESVHMLVHPGEGPAFTDGRKNAALIDLLHE